MAKRIAIFVTAVSTLLLVGGCGSSSKVHTTAPVAAAVSKKHATKAKASPKPAICPHGTVLECEKETFLSLECEAAGFTEGPSAKTTVEEWYVECERAREKEQELSEGDVRTPTPAEAKADCKAEHERDEREG